VSRFPATSDRFSKSFSYPRSQERASVLEEQPSGAERPQLVFLRNDCHDTPAGFGLEGGVRPKGERIVSTTGFRRRPQVLWHLW
jgi:hypothetical protein